MTFGQQPGPPASARQLEELRKLLQDGGYRDFRDARGPMGFTQRQAGGKFTRDEAAALIDRLQNAEADEGAAAGPSPLQHIPSDQLAAELQRRGWIVMEP